MSNIGLIGFGRLAVGVFGRVDFRRLRDDFRDDRWCRLELFVVRRRFRLFEPPDELFESDELLDSDEDRLRDRFFLRWRRDRRL